MSKHSSGPWYWNVNAADYLELRTADEGNPIIGQWGEWPPLSKPDADLIAAAPEMLELLAQVTALCDAMKIGGISTGCDKCWVCRKQALLKRLGRLP